VELEELQHFVALVEEGSFVDAEIRLDQTASSISGSIRPLAREFRAELFVAASDGTELTDAGWATVHRLQHDHPDVDVQVVRDGGRRVLQVVTDGQADLGITPVTARARSSVRLEPMVSAPLALICIADLPRGCWARDAFDRMFGCGRAALGGDPALAPSREAAPLLGIA
jgi:DNA-binding transcriptional LysR family regulator